MHNNSIKLLKNRTVRNKFNIIIALIIVILLFSLINFWFSMKIMSSIRSYVGGEGLWSKNQKEAVNYLVKYSSSQNETDYRKFQTFIKVPMGDKQARLELNKPHPNLTLVRQGFIQGGNNPKDVDDLIFLYRRFRHVSYIDSAIKTWTSGDAEISNLVNIGQQIHGINHAAQRTAKLAPLLQQTYSTDTKLTKLENDFSSTLGEGSRNIAAILTQVTILITTLLGILTIIIAVLIARAIIRLDKVKTDFVSTASHQLRTPLTVINWYAEALLSQAKVKRSKTEQKQLEELYGAAQRAARLVSDLLSVSSLDLGTYRTELKIVDVSEILKTTLRDFKLAINQKQIALTTNIVPNLPKMNLDQRILTVVLQNLLANSVKYTPEGGKIDVSLGIKKSHLLIRVADSGIGIPKSQQEQVFTKLFRADNARQLDSNHSGLGLYITKAMVERLGGSIWFDSAENRGTNFYVKIPIDGHSSKSGKGRRKD